MTFFQQGNRSSPMRGLVFPVGAWLIASLVAGLVGPFATYETMRFGPRLAYWAGLIGVAVPMGLGIRMMVNRLTGRSDARSDLIGALVMAPLFGLMVTLFNSYGIGRVEPSLSALVWNTGVVFLVCLGVIFVRAYGRQSGAAWAPAATIPDVRDAVAAERGPGDVTPAFLQDVAPDIRDGFRWIEADDHYLRVHSDRGTARVLMRFRDALDHLADVPGVRVHRSHWVRTDAIREVRPDGRRHVVVLPCGSEVPVSRTYLPELRAAGVIEDDGAWGSPREAGREGSRGRLRP